LGTTTKLQFVRVKKCYAGIHREGLGEYSYISDGGMRDYKFRQDIQLCAWWV
jgi:hypothetical protein